MSIYQKDNFINEVIEYANTEPFKEVCGFICYKNEQLSFEAVKNHSKDVDYFQISPIDFLQKKMSGDLLAIFHTHINTKEDPSECDIENSKNCLYPFLIYSLTSEKFDLFDLPHFERSEKGVIKLKGLLND